LIFRTRFINYIFFIVDDAGVVEDLIDDNPIEEEVSDAEDSDTEIGKRKKHSDEDDLEEDDFALIEENLGIKVGSSSSVLYF